MGVAPGLMVCVLVLGQSTYTPPGYYTDGEGVVRETTTGAELTVSIDAGPQSDRGFWYTVFANVWEGIASSFLTPAAWALQWMEAQLEAMLPTQLAATMAAVLWHLEVLNQWLPLDFGLAFLAILYFLRVAWFSYKFAKSWIPLVSGS